MGVTVKRTTRTLTLMFTDIEGSTSLLRQLGDDWGDALAAHYSIVREALESHDGREVVTEGDAFFAVFADATSAVRCAQQIHAGLEKHGWPDGAELRVRIGIHTGSVEEHEGNLIGLDIHKAARIGAAAHGGQTLTSASTRMLVADDVAFIELGEHRLKDIPGAVALYQVDDGRERGFPPPRTLDARLLALPTQWVALTGRESEICAVEQSLQQGCRLVTIVGGAGVGKTALALAVAHRQVTASREGIAFVPLAGVSSPDQVVPAIALVVHGDGSTLEHVVKAVREAPILLVLDNMEHVLAVMPQLRALLDAAPQLRLLATSQAPLRMPGERIHQLGPLPTPTTNTLGEVGSSPATQLFCQRLADVNPGFQVNEECAEAIAMIARRLEGNPLALELAAARCRTLTPAQLLTRLDDMLHVLRARTHDERHSSLDAALRWTFDLLTDDAKQVAAGVSAFAGGWTVEQLERVAAAAGVDPVDAVWALEELVEFSLVHPPAEPGGRFTCPASTMQVALQLAASTDVERRWATAHATEMLRLAIAACEDITAVPLLAPEVADYSRALHWTAQHDPDLHTQLIARALPVAEIPGLDLATHATTALARTTDNVDRARLLTLMAYREFTAGDTERSLSTYAEADAAWSGTEHAAERAEALMQRVLTAAHGADAGKEQFDEAEEWLATAESLYAAAGRHDVTMPVLVRANLAVIRSDPDSARRALAHLEEMDWSSPGGWESIAHAHISADCELLCGDFAAAAHVYGLAFRRALARGDLHQCATEAQGIAMSLGGLGRYDEARQLLGAAERMRDDLDFHPNFAWWSRFQDEFVNVPADRQLGTVASEAAWRNGNAVSFDRAIEMALAASP